VFDGVDDVLTTTFAATLGSACTIGRAVPGTGAVITANVNIGTSFSDNVTASTLLITDRALTVGESAAWTAYLNQQLAK
jgi:vacuolar-type H+-ATPase catalytic subunit A/Vma1